MIAGFVDDVPASCCLGPPPKTQGVRVVKTAAIIETSVSGHVAETEVEIQRMAMPARQLLPGGVVVMPQMETREEVVRSGWRRYA